VTAVPPPEGSADPGVPWHHGEPLREQRALAEGRAVVDLSNRGVVTVTGVDRLTWLTDLTTQVLSGLPPGDSALALILSPHGHVEHELHAVDDGDTTWLIVQPGTAPALVDYLRSMQFMLRVEAADRTADCAVVWEPVREVDPAVLERPAPFVGREVIVPRSALAERLASGEPAGTWALEALRVAAAVPRLGLETDHRTLPHEVGWIGPGVHLAKGCYRGQEAVARVHNLGHPPRRLALLHLDGSDENLPQHGDPVVVDGREVGWVGTAAWHHELGPIATAVVKRSTPVAAPAAVRTADGEVAATQETVVLP
jgi:folate-binding protein YgfZ